MSIENPNFCYTLVGLLLATALVTVMTSRLLWAAIALAATSAVLSIIMFLMNAPIAAVFELSVCAGLIPAIFISAISLTRRTVRDESSESKRDKLVRLAFLPAIVVLVGLAMSQLHVPPMFATPAGSPETDVRAVLWNLRHIDLLGQILVMLGGVFAVVVLIKEARYER